MTRNKTFPLGGIEVESFRHLTEDSPIHSLTLPSLAVVPLMQYAGARARWIVAVGDKVAEEQVLAKGLGPNDRDVHSPTPGVLQEFREVPLPGGEISSAAVIRLEGEFQRTGKTVSARDWTSWSPTELLDCILECGVYLESSTLDHSVILPSPGKPLKDLVVNGLQHEPYLTVALTLLEARFEELAEGVRILQKMYSPERTHLVTDVGDLTARLPRWKELMQDVEFPALEFKFPQTQAGLLLKTLEIGQESLVVDVVGVLAIRDAVVEGRPQIERTIVVSGGGARRPGVYRARIGTPLFQFLKNSGGIKPQSEKILVGGPFRGRTVENLASPVVKSTQSVLVLTKTEVNAGSESSCIRCGSCVMHCPVGLEPLNLFKLIRQQNLDQARQDGLEYCIECGICSFVCPSRLPLVETFQTAKEELARE